jgi:hypothetical protein
LKLLPCHGSKNCEKLGAMLPPSRLYPKGEPALSGQYVSRYKCARCKLVTELDTRQWHSLPDLQLEDFEFLGEVHKSKNLADLPTRDFVRNGLSRDQACQMFRAGFLDSLEAEGFVTGPIREQAWHSEESEVYHDSRKCQTGDNISARYLVVGKGGKRRCSECARVTGERRKGRRK